MNNKLYWKKNIRYIIILLGVWFTVSFGFGILFKENLDAFSIGGFKLGFWFAQQGSMYIFVILIFIYDFPFIYLVKHKAVIYLILQSELKLKLLISAFSIVNFKLK